MSSSVNLLFGNQIWEYNSHLYTPSQETDVDDFLGASKALLYERIPAMSAKTKLSFYHLVSETRKCSDTKPGLYKPPHLTGPS